MGKAIYESGLPTQLGIAMYAELDKARHGLVTQTGDLHLVYVLLLEHPFSIFDWSYWAKLFDGLPAKHKEVGGSTSALSVWFLVFSVWRTSTAGKQSPAKIHDNRNLGVPCRALKARCKRRA